MLLSPTVCGGRYLIRRRRSPRVWIRSGIITFIIVFFWSRLTILSYRESSDNSTDYNDSLAAILNMVPSGLHKFLTPHPRNASGDLQNGSYGVNISEMKRNIAQYNSQQTVYNDDLFGALQNDSIIIVIQVHDRITYLRHLIVSLAQAQNISQSIIIFSHDVYDEDINSLVQSIDFCKVVQIFYPYSIQVHPHEFPGEDPNDCPRDIKREQALILKCTNALFPDLYGHYREAKFTQTKHHWWWKANYVFNELEVTRNYSGLLLFLEEDHFVAEDFIHVVKLMDQTCKSSCQHCNVLSLGAHRIKYQYDKQVEISPWVSNHNMGMAFNRSTWMQIVECADHFCNYDDYNWDWSLEHLSQNCLKQELHVMVIKGPRVFHIGECGVHHNKKKCESTAVMYTQVQNVLKSAKRHLYPDYLTLTSTSLTTQKLRKFFGGWGDHRDHMLCMGMTLN